LAKLIELMPAIRTSITRLLKQTEINRGFAAAALVDLIACTAIRPGSEAYARERGTRGAATLLKKHVQIKGDEIALCFLGKGGKQVEKQIRSRRLARSITRLGKIPGKRLFQYLSEGGADANAFLREITDDQISLKDFRTLSACSQALEHLLRVDPKPSPRAKRAQIKAVLREVANNFANTPAVCRKSYVHAVVIQAFETGQLKKPPSGGQSNESSNGDRLLQKILQDVVELKPNRIYPTNLSDSATPHALPLLTCLVTKYKRSRMNVRWSVRSSSATLPSSCRFFCSA
jgi:DNA topoisomerase-1